MARSGASLGAYACTNAQSAVPSAKDDLKSVTSTPTHAHTPRAQRSKRTSHSEYVSEPDVASAASASSSANRAADRAASSSSISSGVRSPRRLEYEAPCRLESSTRAGARVASRNATAPHRRGFVSLDAIATAQSRVHLAYRQHPRRLKRIMSA